MTATDGRSPPPPPGVDRGHGGGGQRRLPLALRRLAPPLTGVVGVGAVGLIIMGGGRGASVGGLVVALATAGAVALARRPRRTRTELPWSAAPGTRPPDAGPPTAPTTPRGAPSTPRQVACALSRVEARELASSPWFGIGLGLLGVVVLALVALYPDDNGGSWAGTASLVPFLVHPLVGMVVLASHRAVTRARRDGAAELFDTCPAGTTTRAVGVLLTAWVPVAATACFVGILGGGLAVRSSYLHGPLGAGAAVSMLAAVVLGVGGVALGVALGRWVGFALAPVAVVVAIGFGSARLVTQGDPGWSPLRLLSTTPLLSETSELLPDPPAWSNLGWLIGLTLAVVLIALGRDRWDRGVAVGAVIAGVLILASGVAAARPVPAARAARLADLVARPAAHQSCAGGSVEVCVYSASEVRDRVITEVGPVAAALPASAPRITLRQGYDSLVAAPPGVIDRLPGGIPPRGDGEVRLAFDFSPAERRTPRLQVAFAALGLPTEPGEGDRPAVVAGQARGVVALWLATRGLDPGVSRELTTARGGTNRDAGGPDSFDRGYVDWPNICGTSPVVWSAQDLAAARSLVAAPEAAVKAVVHTGWERWRLPGTGTDELLAALGLAAVGPFDAVETRPEPQC
ncbi:MAG: hypothetical protein ABIS47_01415 [Acidimicrobiales bacterium]